MRRPAEPVSMSGPASQTDGAGSAEGFSEVGNTGLQGPFRSAFRAPDARGAAASKAMAAACALSLLAHAGLLLAVRRFLERPPARPALVMTLTGAFVAPVPRVIRPAAPVAVAPPAPAPHPPPQVAEPPRRDAKAPALSPPAPAPRPVRAAPPPPAPDPEPQTGPVQPEAAPQEVFRPASGLSRVPVPQAMPDVEEAGVHLVGRRLQVKVWIDAEGAVRKSEVTPNEVTRDVVERLEEAIGRVRFTPGLLDGVPTAAEVDTRLCFDEAGQLDASSAECWRPEPTAAAAPPPAPASAPAPAQ
jgi:hypothetical protein